MILGVRANREEFNEVKFEEGFNVVIAERTLESTKKDSRNGLGKTTLIEIIHFCLGADINPDTSLRDKELAGWIFTLDIVFGGKNVSVSRGTNNLGYVVIDAYTDWSEWIIQPDFDNKSNEARIKITEWTKLLGWALYGLIEDNRRNYIPTFRSLVSYDIRRRHFDNPFENFPRQYIWDIQVNNAYILDLNWEYARKWQLLRERKTELDNLKKATKGGQGLLASLLGTIGELENEKERLERIVDQEWTNLNGFQVLQQYEQIESDANKLTEQIHNLTNAMLQTRRLIEFHEKSLSEEEAANENRVAEIYKEAGIVLPGSGVKSLDEVQVFHKQVTQNRRNYLRSEITRLRNEISGADTSREQLVHERSRLMQILATHGALAEYTKLQQLYLSHVAELETINSQIQNLKKIEREKSQIKIERENLFLDARTDYDERTIIRDARKIFNNNSEALYEAPGDLVVDIKQDSGYSFRVDIKRSGSDGIDKMKVFCYDLMRAELSQQFPLRPKFLIHDSTIFADVDERQIARALELAALKSKQFGFQYIVMLNSDKVPWDEFNNTDFDLNNYIRLVLTDDKPAGSLLGIRF